MKFSKSDIYFILYVLLTVGSVFLDLSDNYAEKLRNIINKIAGKVDEEVKNGD